MKREGHRLNTGQRPCLPQPQLLHADKVSITQKPAPGTANAMVAVCRSGYTPCRACLPAFRLPLPTFGAPFARQAWRACVPK